MNAKVTRKNANVCEHFCSLDFYASSSVITFKDIASVLQNKAKER